MLLRCSTHRPTLSAPWQSLESSWHLVASTNVEACSWRANSRPYFCLSPPPGPLPTTRHVLGKLLEGGAPPPTTLPQRRPPPPPCPCCHSPTCPAPISLPRLHPGTPAPAPSCSSLNLSAFSSPTQPTNPSPRVVAPLAKSVLPSLPESPPFPSPRRN